ncbi:hypothetical protein G7Y89_g7655 [Cudoniella acicularis]|uniref:Importin N-terminal domain-containing protein n=1 Tax=Cudoniella acicularis TaxID=354080 RepID=A0A8H4W3L1_9HELO|nr:hypothetical protein G7Y89_g7655 [Cudoniella acicularis]
MASLRSLLLLPLLIVSHLVEADIVQSSSSLPRSNQPQLTAITVRSGIQKRAEDFRPRQHCEHLYASHSPDRSGSRFAKTSMTYKLPALVLEDIETSVESVQCSGSTIAVKFSERQTLVEARSKWDKLAEFLIITSHFGCNMEGERSPHLVSGIEYNSEKPIAIFSTQQIEWKAAYETMNLKFGLSSMPYESSSFRHEGLRRARAVATSSSSNSSTTDNIAFQAPADQELFTLSTTIKGITSSATVNCKDCSIAGTIQIIEGEFNVSTSTTDFGKALDFINTGFLKAVANNMSAHIEVDANLDLSASQSFNKTLTTIGIPGFEIPGIATVGPSFSPVVKGSIAAVGEIDFGYGFDLTVPDNSSITLNIGNLTQSSVQGFNKAQLNALPLTATSPGITVTLGLTLEGQLNFGINVLNGEGKIEAGAFLDLPVLSATISTTSGDDKCQPIANLSAADALTTHIFPNLTHITGSIGVDVGLQVDAALSVADVGSTSVGTTATLAGTTFTLPTACLSFDATKTALVSPTFTPTATAHAGSSANSTLTGAGSLATNDSSSGSGGAKALPNHGIKTRSIPSLAMCIRFHLKHALLCAALAINLAAGSPLLNSPRQDANATYTTTMVSYIADPVCQPGIPLPGTVTSGNCLHFAALSYLVGALPAVNCTFTTYKLLNCLPENLDTVYSIPAGNETVCAYGGVVDGADTDRVKAATTELRKTYYPHPESLLWLLHILTSHDAPEVQQQAAVEALRLVPKHWAAQPAAQQPAIREKLLESTLSEQKSLVRHSSARVIAAIAKIDLEDGEWGSLPSLLAQAATSNQVSHREVGVYILFTLLEAAGDAFEDKVPSLFTLFTTTIKDPESAEVRINTLMCLSRVAMLIQPDEDAQNLARFIEIFPSMVAVLKAAVDEENEEHTMQAFEVFQTLLGCESALLNAHFKDFLTFMADLAANTEVPDDSRNQALSFLMQAARYRKMKIQGTKDMGENLTLKCMQIATEITDDEDEDDEVNPHRSALGLLDILAATLPPRQVIVPLLKALPQYINSESPKFRQAGILSLGMCVEGAPDFIGTQLDTLMPGVLKLLNDPVIGVRHAALLGVARLADDLAEDLSKHHAELIPSLLKNLDSASVLSSNETEQRKNLEILKASCGALDSVTDGLDKETMSSYLPELVPRLGRLLSHTDLTVKASAAGAMGSIAGSAMDAFLPYFETTMKALSEYVTIKDSQDELDLRATVCDSMGSMATAVGAATFQPYVQPLMQASEEGLNLGHPRLRETSYILWSTLAKVYEEAFTPFLDGVVKGLMDSLNQEESDFEVELGEEAKDLLGQEVIVAGKKIKVASATNEPEDLDGMEGDDDDDWDDLEAVSAVAFEKEIAIEVLGDVLSHTRKNFVPYFEKAIETVMGLVEHPYEGVRKTAVGTLWRAYACLWGLMEDHTGQKWTPGLPLKFQPSEEVLKLGEVVTTATLSLWEDEVDRAVVTDINRNVAATLKLCGPAILTQASFAERTSSILASIITKSHPCQQDIGDEDDHENLQDEESSEYDWLVIDTALDVVIGLSAALGDQFAELWKIFQKPVMKYASSQTNYERSTAIGVIAECTANMGSGVSPYTQTLLKLLLHRLTDEDDETKSNAAYATGLLVFHSKDSATYLPAFKEILTKLEPLLHTQRARNLDNASGCVCRMIMAHQDQVPVDDIIPILVDLLPLKEDYEENKPIYECITGLYQHENPTIIGLTPKLIPVFASVLDDPVEQLDLETRNRIIAVVKFIHGKNPSLIQGSQILMNCV